MIMIQKRAFKIEIHVPLKNREQVLVHSAPWLGQAETKSLSSHSRQLGHLEDERVPTTMKRNQFLCRIQPQNSGLWCCQRKNNYKK